MALRRRVILPALRRFRPLQSVRANGRATTIDVRDPVIGTLLYLTGEYEPELATIIKGLAPHVVGHVALDIGANLGLHTQALSESVGLQGRVIAVEPEPHNLALL